MDIWNKTTGNTTREMTDAIGDTWVNETGDTMSGDLNMGDKNITHVQNITLGSSNEAYFEYNGTHLLIVG